MIVYLSDHEPVSEEEPGAHAEQEKSRVTNSIAVSSSLSYLTC